MSEVAENKVKKDEMTVVSLKPIIRKGWLPQGHDGEYKFTGALTWLVAPIDPVTGQRITGLTEEDEERLEKALRLPRTTLNKYNKDYWGKFKIVVPKEGKDLYLSNPMHEIELAVLKNNPLVAKTEMDVIESPGASFYLSSPQKEAEVKNVKYKLELAASKIFYSTSAEKKIDMLRVFQNSLGRMKVKYTKSTPADMIEADLYEILKENPEEFIRVYEDKSFNTKVLILNLVDARILTRMGSKYSITGGDIIGYTLDQTIDYLDDPSNQMVLIELKSKLDSI